MAFIGCFLSLVMSMALQPFVVHCITPEDLYPFGVEEGDSVLEAPVTDFKDSLSVASAGVSSTTTKFVFYGTNYTSASITVHSHGIISLSSNPGPIFQQLQPGPFPVGISSLLVPYWAFGVNGGQTFYRVTNDSDLLSRAGSDVWLAFPDEDGLFIPTILIIVTWSNLTEFNTDLHNTFQCVVIANGQKTFTLFLYPEGGIQWGVGAQIGLDSGSSHSIVSNFMHPTALTNDSLTVEDTSNIGVSGKWAFRVDTLVQLQPGENHIIADFDSKQYIINEGSGSVDVCVYISFIGNVELSEPLNLLIETLTPRENIDSAQRGGDYEALSANLNFTSSGNQCVNIDIFDDNRVERTERFHVNLLQLSDEVLFINPRVSVIIEDNDVPTSFPFGTSAGDNVVPTAIDGSSNSISLSSLFPFFGTPESILYVNTNGVLSFRGSFTEYSPTMFPGTSFPLIAPFWQDFNIEISGHIFYRETTSPNQLQLASDIISSTFSRVPDDFKPAYLFIATWSNAAEFSGSSSVTNTFQVVLATDGSLSFIFFIYIDINWGGSTQLGFNAGDGIHSFTLHEAFNFTAIRNLASTSNVDIPGFYLFRVDSQQILRPIDIPPTMIRFEESDYSVSEEHGEFEVCVLADGLSVPVEVLVEAVSLAAQVGNDFSFATTTLEFKESSIRQCVNISILDDVHPEQIEQFVLNLTILSFSSSNFRLSDVTINIIDNDLFSESFFPFGKSSGDTLINMTLQNGHSGPIKLNSPFPFFGETEDGPIYINEDGILSFERPLSFPLPTQFSSFSLGNESLIAPFWSEIDVVTRFGNIWYRLTYDTEDLALATELIQKHASTIVLPAFNATYLFIATWERVSSNMGSFENTNSFQVVLATDGKVSFAFYIYGTLQFGNSSNIGFRKSSVRNYMVSDALSTATNVASLSNIGIHGVFLYRIDLHFILPANDNQFFVDFERNNYTVNEDSRVVEVCVSIDAIGNVEFSEPFSLILETSTTSGAIDSALGGNDYEPLSVSLNFSVLGEQQCVNISILEDNVVEITEWFQVNLLQIPSEVFLNNPSIPIIIVDNDGLFPFGTYAGDDQVQPIRQGSSSSILLSIPFPFFGMSESTLFVNVIGVLSFRSLPTNVIATAFDRTTMPLIAVFWDNYFAIQTFGNIFYREISTPHLLQAAADIINAKFDVLSDSAKFKPAYLFIATWNKVAGFAQGSAANTLQVVLATDGTTSYVFFIYYDIQWAGFLGTQLGFGAGDGIHSFRLPEAFNTLAILNLESTSNIDIPGHYLFRVDAAQIIQPKDLSIVSFEKGDYVVGEEDGTLEVCVTGFALSPPAIVHVEAVSSSANAGNDFMFTPISLMFSQAVDRQCVNVTILDDSQREREEQFSLNLTLLHMNESSIRLNLTKTTVTIIDNDLLSESFFPFGKGAGDILVNITTPNGHSGPISLDSPLPFFGGVEDGPLYVNENGVLSFELPLSIMPPILLFAPTLGNVKAIAPFWSDIDVTRTMSGNIWYRLSYDPKDLAMASDLIKMLAHVAPPDFNASYLFIATWEHVHSVSSFLVPGKAVNSFQVVLATDGIATFAFFIYGSLQYARPSTIGFKNFNSHYMPISTFSGETTFSFMSNVGVLGVYLYRIDLRNILEANDIRYVAGLLDSSYTVNEGSGPLEVCVHMLSGINQPIDLLLQSTDIFYANDSATRGSDFQQLQVHLIFTSAGKQCVEINIIDDDVLEIMERFRVELFFQNNPNVIFEGRRLQVNIEDNDVVNVGFERESYSVTEVPGGVATVKICVQLQGKIQRKVHISVSVQSGDATNGLDYTGGTFDLAFSGMPSDEVVNDSQCSLLQVLDDDLVEGRETLTLAIRTSDPSVLLLTNQTTTVSIIDDEGENRNQPIRFIKKSPRVTGRSIHADLYISEDIEAVECQIIRRFNGKTLQKADCSHGSASFYRLSRRIGLSLVVRGTRADSSVEIRRDFRTESNMRICSVHLINDGIVITGNSAIVRWQVTGPSRKNRADTILCSLDGGHFITCASPYTINHLTSGSHQLRIRPDHDGCAKIFSTNVKLEIP